MSEDDVSRSGAGVERLRGGLRLALAAQLGLLLGDAGLLAWAHANQGPGTLGAALASAYFASLPITLLAGLLLALLGAVIPAAERPLPARAWRWLTPDDEAAALRRAARLQAVTVLGLAYAGAMTACSYGLALRIVREHFLALAVSGASLGLLAVAALLLPPLERTLLRASRAVGRIPLLRRVVAAPLGWTLAVALVAATGAIALLVRYWRILVYLPWPILLRVAFALAFTATAWYGGPRLPARWRRGGWVLVAAGALAATVVAVRLPHHAHTAQRLAFEELLTGRAGFAFFATTWDFDGDGHISILGGGDCAPFDPSVHPSAVDIPDDGVDQNCDGADLTTAALPVEGRYDFPVPDSVPERPDIVLVTIDAVSPRHMKALGYRREVMPNLDALAARAAFFSSAFAEGPSTRLSFPSLFTSRWDSELERRRSPRAPHPITCRGCLMAEILEQVGYDTRAVVPDRYFQPSRWEGIQRGFALFDLEAARSHGNNAEAVTRRSLRALERRDPDAPLFLWVHYYDPHSPHDQPQTAPVYGDAIEDRYDAELTDADAHVEQLRRAVREASPDALFIVTSDHATVFHPTRGHGHARYGQDILTATLHVPLIFDAPWLRGGRHDGVVTLLDVLPTLANLLRLPPGRTFRGQSLVPELLEGREARPPLVFHQFYLPELIFLDREPFEQVSVRTDRYHLVLDRRRGRERLFDWRQDYYEQRDLLDRASPPAELAGLRDTLQSYLNWTEANRGNPAPDPSSPPRPRRRRPRR